MLWLFSRSVASDCFATTWAGAHQDPLFVGFFQARTLERAAISFFRGVFPAQGWNLRLLHWQVGSVPLRHQGKTPWRMHRTCHIADVPKSHVGPASRPRSSCPRLPGTRPCSVTLQLCHSPMWSVVSTLQFYSRGNGQEKQSLMASKKQGWLEARRCSSRAPDLSCPLRIPALVQKSPLLCPWAPT